MQQYFLVFLLVLLGALGASSVLTPIVRRAALRWGAMDTPDARKIHTSPIPRLGGLAIWIALWAAALLATRAIPPDQMLIPSSSLPELAGIFAGATVVLVIGMTDDRLGEMRPATKLVGQFVAC